MIKKVALVLLVFSNFEADPKSPPQVLIQSQFPPEGVDGRKKSWRHEAACGGNANAPEKTDYASHLHERCLR